MVKVINYEQDSALMTYRCPKPGGALVELLGVLVHPLSLSTVLHVFMCARHWTSFDF